MQFGGDYKRTRAFKEKFVDRLKLVRTLYRQVDCSVDPDGLILAPTSRPHIPKISQA